MDILKAVYLPVGVFSVLVMVLALQGVVGSNWDTVAVNVTPVILLMSFIGFIVGLAYGGGGSLKTVIAVVTFGSVGIIVDVIFEHLYTQGILFDEYISGSITVPDVMSVILIFWTLLGIVVGVTRD